MCDCPITTGSSSSLVSDVAWARLLKRPLGPLPAASHFRRRTWRRSVPPAVAGGFGRVQTHPLSQVVLTFSKYELAINVDLNTD